MRIVPTAVAATAALLATVSVAAAKSAVGLVGDNMLVMIDAAKPGAGKSVTVKGVESAAPGNGEATPAKQIDSIIRQLFGR